MTADAAIVMGMAGTAMPFARSVAEQAERWLRILSSCGDAGGVLASLGVADDRTDRPADDAADPDGPSGAGVGRDPVAAVARCAERVAQDANAPGIRLSDLLRAVMTVYGSEFERVLSAHGVQSTDVLERLDGLRRPA